MFPFFGLNILKIFIGNQSSIGLLSSEYKNIFLLNNWFTRSWPPGNGEEKRSRVGQKGESQSESELGENPIEELDMAQLEQLKASLQGLKHDVARQAEQILIQNLNPPQPMDTQNTSTKKVLIPFDTWRSWFNTNMNVAPDLNTNPTMAPYNTNMSVAPHGYTFGYENGNGFF